MRVETRAATTNQAHRLQPVGLARYTALPTETLALAYAFHDLDNIRRACNNVAEGHSRRTLQMTRDEVLATLRNYESQLRGYGVVDLALFGSIARGEETPHSDVDILVDFEKPPSIFGFLDAKDYLEGILGRPVDLVMRNGLKPQLREQILEEAVHAL